MTIRYNMFLLGLLLVTATSIFLTSPTIAQADTANYSYDELGRLTQVTIGTNITNYEYDEVGNILSVTTGSLTNSPSITSVTPTTLLVGAKTSVTFTGQNLLSLNNATPLNNNILIENIAITPTKITALLTATNGSGDTVTLSFRDTGNTVYQTNISAVSSSVVITPALVAAPPNSTTSASVSLNPALAVPVIIGLKSSDMAVATIPDSITIPAGGSATLPINTKLTGFTSITNRSDDVYGTVVTDVRGGGNGVTSKPVSVSITPSVLSYPSAMISRPVSVSIDGTAQPSTPSVKVSRPVSVSIDKAVVNNPSVKISPLVSVKISQ